MSTTITPLELIEAQGEVDVECPGCGWNARGELKLLDRYFLDAPPIPPMDLREVTRDAEEGAIGFCPECDEELTPDTVVRRLDHRPAHGRCDDCPGGKCACWVDDNEGALKVDGEWPS